MLGFGRKKKDDEGADEQSGPGDRGADEAAERSGEPDAPTGGTNGSGIDLERHHIADLHALAAELGVDGYRKLERPKLIEAISSAGDVGAAYAKAISAPTLIGHYSEIRLDRGGAQSGGGGRQQNAERSGGGRGRRGSRGGRARGDSQGDASRGRGGRARSETSSEPRSGQDRARGSTPDKPAEDEKGEPVEGVLDLMPRRFGFLRLQGLEAHEGDVYVSASQVRRCELRAGDWVAGPARPPRERERHPALIHVDSVNGSPPEGDRLNFDELTPIAPSRRVDLGAPDTGDATADALVRAVDLLAPVALGQRVLLHAGPRSGCTTLLRGLANCLSSSKEELSTIVLLIDERPEEATAWMKAVPDCELAITTAEQSATEHLRAAELALQRARRQVEAGRDVVMLIDSLSRLAVAAEDTDKVKALFGAGRDASEEGAGSLTVIATALDDGVEPDAAAAVLRTESSLIRLDSDLAAAGVTPAIRVSETRVSGEEELRSPDELERVRGLRAELLDLETAEAAKKLAELLDGARTNGDL